LSAGGPDNPKTLLRQRVLAQRDALDARTRAAHSRRITERLLALPAYRDARCVLAYMSFGSEPGTGLFVAHALHSGKHLVLPRVDRTARALRLHRVEDPARDLEAGVWGIREPRSACPAATPDEIDFVLVPGVAFTERGERLGYGGGYYDRLIPRFRRRSPLVAGAFSLQLQPALPVDAFDQRMDLVVTEERVYEAGAAG
jgi:5-formyltetrahydrofolate cyclo-ligase